MAHALTVVPLRLGLRLLRLVQPALPPREQGAVAHAARLRLTPTEKRSEAAVDALRHRLATCDDDVAVVDHGTGTRGELPPVRRVSQIYRRASTGPAWGRFLFGLTRALRPRRVLELGTNLGVGAAHLAQALCLNEEEGGAPARFVTLEGDPDLAARAAGSLARLGHAVGDDEDNRVRVVVGPFAETLAATAEEEGPFDLVFVDGHHEEEAALGYLDTLRSHLTPDGVVILDDVEPWRSVGRAWRRLRAVRPAIPALFMGKYGILAATPETVGGAVTALGRESPTPRSTSAGA